MTKSVYFSKFLFGIFFLIYITVAWYLGGHLNIYYNDTVSRTANAFFTVFGRQPHLAAIGLVWLPLPSLVQIPLVLVLHGWGWQMLSGPIVTAFLGAASVVVVDKISRLLNEGKRSALSILVTILYGLNPMIGLYAAIGSSETTFIFSLLLFSYFFLKWYLKSGIFDLVLADFSLVLALGSRYESVAVFVSGIVVVMVVELAKKSRWQKIQPQIVLFGLPFTYAFGLWMLINWLIMGNPLFFMNSVYSNSNFTGMFQTNRALLEGSYHSLVNSMVYAGKRILLLAPGLVLGPLAFSRDFLLLAVLVAPYGSILVFHVFQVYGGQSFGWLRFFIYSIVAVTLMALYFINKHKGWGYVVVGGLVVGCVSTVYAMSNYNYGKEESSFVAKIENPRVILDYSRTYADQKAVATFMNGKKGRVLLDTASGFAIPLFSANPEKYVITSDTDFLNVLNTFQSEVNWVIMPDPSLDLSKNNLISARYPEMWEGQMPVVRLDKQIDDWRVFKVVH